MAIIQRIEGHYDVQEVEFGKVYRWCPERIIAECRCGEKTSLTASSTATCRRCGTDLAVVFRENRLPGGRGTKSFTPGAMLGTAKAPESHAESTDGRNQEER